MQPSEEKGSEFARKLKQIEEDGIQADRKHLKCNMYSQFSDPLEFAREYVVNSFDAGATDCFISGRETETTVTVTIRDNGSGMNLKRLQDYFKIFRSTKDIVKVRAVGQFGVGKLSVAAIPGLTKFSGVTSTGTECWRFETTTLIEDTPVVLERIEPVPKRGTVFEITLRKDQSLGELLSKIQKLLYKYLRHLDINVWFDLPVVDENMNPLREKLRKGNWQFDEVNLGRSYTAIIDGEIVEVIMGLGNAEHEIYQKRVYITSKYNLVTFRDNYSLIRNLKVRADSDLFHLTFGRHCLSNENVLYRLASHISSKILPSYFEYLWSQIDDEFIYHHPDLVEKIDDLACSLIEQLPGYFPWYEYKLFRVLGSARLSYNDLLSQVKNSGALYVESRDNEGADYSKFNGPVLSSDQPRALLDLLKKKFNSTYVDLNETDVVLEAAPGSDHELTAGEKLFESFLVFKPKEELLNKILDSVQREKKYTQGISNEKLNATGICEEARIAGNDFNAIVWKVNYLVERDGVTPCKSRRFIYSRKKVILNLHHPEIRQFVELSLTDPGLSAHWALAMCLSDMKFLPHITPDAREDLLLIDSMSRLDGEITSRSEVHLKKRGSLIDFIRGLS